MQAGVDELVAVPQALRDEIKSHLRTAVVFSDQELQRAAALSERLPTSIVDAHAHIGLLEHVLAMPSWVQSHIIASVMAWPLETARRFEGQVFPSASFRAVRFAMPIAGINFAAANEYLLRSCLASGDAFVAFGHSSCAEMTISLLRSDDCRGLKCYHRAHLPPARRIAEFFHPEFLEICNDEGKPIILHLPAKLRECADEIMSALMQYRDIPVILAHCGLMERIDPDDVAALQMLAANRNLYVDTSMIMDVDVLRSCISLLSHKRVLFGLDQPLASYRAAYRRNGRGESRVVPERPYSWLSDASVAPAEECSLLAFTMIECLLAACSELGLGQHAIEEIFGGNASSVFGLASR
jgi:hypothetical protein